MYHSVASRDIHVIMLLFVVHLAISCTCMLHFTCTCTCGIHTVLTTRTYVGRSTPLPLCGALTTGANMQFTAGCRSLYGMCVCAVLLIYALRGGV